MTELKVVTYFFGKFFSAIISLAIIPLFISWFGEIKYGEYILIYTTFLIFISGSMGWINQSMIKFHGDYNEDRENFYVKVHRLSYQMAIMACVPLLFMVYLSTKEVTAMLIIFIAFGFIVACKYTSKLFENQSELNSLKFSIAEIIRLIVFFCSVYFLKFLVFFSSLETIFLSLFLGYFIAYLFLNKGLKYDDLILSFKFDKDLIKKFMTFGLPLSVWMMFSPSANGVDRYILNYYLGAGVLAQYAAVYDVVFKVFTQLANPINSVYQPLLMKINSSGDETLFNKTMIRAFLYLLFLCIPVFIFVYLFQDFILINYLGFEDQETLNQLKQIIMPLAAAGFIWQIAIIAQKQLEAKDKTLMMTVVMVTVVGVFSIITALLIPKYGILAAAYTAILSSIFYLIIICLINRNENKKRILKR
jgi:O-antigen/teichoic acid export membrane protein